MLMPSFFIPLGLLPNPEMTLPRAGQRIESCASDGVAAPEAMAAGLAGAVSTAATFSGVTFGSVRAPFLGSANATSDFAASMGFFTAVAGSFSAVATTALAGIVMVLPIGKPLFLDKPLASAMANGDTLYLRPSENSVSPFDTIY